MLTAGQCLHAYFHVQARLVDIYSRYLSAWNISNDNLEAL